MKKIFLIFVSLFCISCSQINSYVEGDIKNGCILNRVDENLTRFFL